VPKGSGDGRRQLPDNWDQSGGEDAEYLSLEEVSWQDMIDEQNAVVKWMLRQPRKHNENESNRLRLISRSCSAKTR
jgi:hypothetical protein